MFSEAADTTNEPKLKKLFSELEQCSRKHHARMFDALKKDSDKGDVQWLRNLLWLEMENHSLYNRLMAGIVDPSTRQLFQQLRDAKMRSITLLQEELRPRGEK